MERKQEVNLFLYFYRSGWRSIWLVSFCYLLFVLAAATASYVTALIIEHDFGRRTILPYYTISGPLIYLIFWRSIRKTLLFGKGSEAAQAAYFMDVDLEIRNAEFCKKKTGSKPRRTSKYESIHHANRFDDAKARAEKHIDCLDHFVIRSN